MSCDCCESWTEESIKEAVVTAERGLKSESAIERYWAQRFLGWVEDMIKPSIFDKIAESPSRGRAIHWKAYYK